MADTLDNITVPDDDWLDFYTVASITVGTNVRVQNIGQTDILYVVNATKPTDLSAYNVSSPGKNSIDRWIETGSGASGLWLRSRVNDGLVNGQEV